MTTSTIRTSRLDLSVLMIVLLQLATSVAYAQDFLSLDFEDANSRHSERGWKLSNGASIQNSESEQGYVLVVDADEDGRQEFSQGSKISNDKLTCYQLSVKVKTDTTRNERVYLWLEAFNSEDLSLNKQSITIEPSIDWQTDTLILFVPSNAKRIQIAGSVHDNSKAWFDDFSIEKKTLDTSIYISPSAQAYIDSALSIMQKNALHRDRLNFKEIRQITRYYAEGAESIEDTHAAIFKAIDLLADNHSNFGPADQVKRALNLDTLDVEKLRSDIPPEPGEGLIDSLSKIIDYGKSALLKDQIGYISVPAFSSLYKELQVLFADTIRNRIAELDRQKIKGWIIDLRDNSGGSTYPMVLGVGALLDEDNKLQYVNGSSKVLSTHRVENGGYYIEQDDSVSLVYTSNVLHDIENNKVPIAVLINWVGQHKR